MVFEDPQNWSTELGDAAWTAEQRVRLIGDVDGDGLDDVVGISEDKVLFARNTGTSFAPLDLELDSLTHRRLADLGLALQVA